MQKFLLEKTGSNLILTCLPALRTSYLETIHPIFMVMDICSVTLSYFGLVPELMNETYAH